MDRNLWKRGIGKHSLPPYPCSICGKGTLQMVPKSLVHYETVNSKNSRMHDEFDESWVDYVFSAWARCNYSDCSQDYAVVGKGGVEPYSVEDGFEYEDQFKMTYCRPMPDMFALPKKCPADIAKELRASFELFFLNTPACVGRIRTAVERLMDFVGIRGRRRGKGKFVTVTLHERIVKYSANEPHLGKRLMAIKWLGNTGVHKNGVTEDEILDSYEILEHALAEIVDDRTAHIDRLAKNLSKKHGKK